MRDLVRGRLAASDGAPAAGERCDTLAELGTALVEHIVSGRVEPATYCQDHDEWVMVLEGAARLTVGGAPIDLAPGDWVVLPAGVRHDVVRVRPGTRWLAVHAR